MAVNLAQIADGVYGKMGIPSTSTIFDRTKIVIPKINSVYLNTCMGYVANILDQTKTYKAPFLRVLSRSDFIHNPTATTLSSDANKGDLVLSLDTTNYLATGWVLVEGQVIKYTGKSATQLTGLSPAVQVKIESGKAVYQLFPFSGDISKPYQLQQVQDDFTVNFIDDRAPKFGNYWTIKTSQDGTQDLVYINQQDVNYRLDYYIKPNEMTDDADESVLSDKDTIDIISNLVAGELLYSQYGDDPLGVRGKVLLNTGYGNLETFYAQQAERAKVFRKTVKRRPWT